MQFEKVRFWLLRRKKKQIKEEVLEGLKLIVLVYVVVNNNKRERERER